MAAAEREDPIAGQEVQVFVALAVDQVRAVAANPLAIEAEGAQDPSELRVEVALVERHRVGGAQLEQIGDVRRVRVVRAECHGPILAFRRPEFRWGRGRGQSRMGSRLARISAETISNQRTR